MYKQPEIADCRTIQVLPRQLAEGLRPDPMAVCISITNPRQRPARLIQGAWLDVLRLGFHDTDVPMGNFTAMYVRQARDLIRFARQHRDHPITVHCEFGASRSVAAGLFLAVWLKRQLSLVDPVLAPNPWVIRQLRLAGLLEGASPANGADLSLLATSLLGPLAFRHKVLPPDVAETYLAP